MKTYILLLTCMLILSGCIKARPQTIIIPDEKPKINVTARHITGNKFQISIIGMSKIPMFFKGELKSNIKTDNMFVISENDFDGDMTQLPLDGERNDTFIEVSTSDNAPRETIRFRFVFMPWLGEMRSKISGDYYYKYVYVSNEVEIVNK